MAEASSSLTTKNTDEEHVLFDIGLNQKRRQGNAGNNTTWTAQPNMRKRFHVENSENSTHIVIT